MINVQDEILSGEPKYRIRDSGGNLLYDNTTIEMITPVVQQPTALNKALFDLINADIEAKVRLDYKASTAEAQVGTDDTKWMTPLKTKETIFSNRIIKYNELQLSTSGNNTITLSDYITNNVNKLEIIINADYNNDYTEFKINGSGIYEYGGMHTTGGASVALCTPYQYLIYISIHPKQQLMRVFGSGVPTHSAEVEQFDKIYGYNTLTNITMPRLRGERNIPHPASVIQYFD